ncbi:MAG: SCO family protein [Thermomicrobiales bacterium]|nr:SCO family protein [Thermomicrobiales bacterium]MCO5217332.1 SCO family protein [Thermomicrobiales bacterium]MCO5226180.1 SCO family protein [Thermomicrobiales bacterium]MCO5228705.1 SCO family protein [Thermomicrobiales bacterium]
MGTYKRALPWILGTVAMLVLTLFAVIVFIKLGVQEPYRFHGATYDPPRKTPELVMTDQHGKEFRLSDHSDKVVLVFFGYTFCPDYCPATMSEVTEILAMLGDDAEHVEVVFVSVDPARDTPERLGEFVEFFNPDIYGLSASEEQTARIKADWGVIGEAQPVKDQGSYYLVSHTTTLFSVNTDGNLGPNWAFGTDPELVTEDIRNMIHN